MSITRFCIVRHGETDWNVEKRLQGQLEVELNPTGMRQAAAVRPGLAGLEFAAAYSSDLKRAWRTAEIATEGLAVPLAPHEALRERHYGVFQGLTADEGALQHPETHRQHVVRSLDNNYETGESLREFAVRVLGGLADLAARHRGETVLLFTHGGVLDVIYRVACDRPLQAPRDFPIPNAGLNWIEYRANEQKAWHLLNWADQRHLELALDELT